MQRTDLAKYILIAALGVLFVLLGVDKLINPGIWITWIPFWLDGAAGLDGGVWLMILGVLQFVLGILILVPYRKTHIVAAALMIAFLAFTVLGTGFNDIGLRDLGLLASAVALLLLVL